MTEVIRTRTAHRMFGFAPERSGPVRVRHYGRGSRGAFERSTSSSLPVYWSVLLRTLLLWLIIAIPFLHAGGPLIEVNRGQYPSEVKYLLKTESGAAAITSLGVAFAAGGERIVLRFAGANLGDCVAASKREAEANYLGGPLPYTHVPAYSSIACRGLYAGIDWTVHVDNQVIEHDWRVAAEADPAKIAISLDHGVSASIGPSGDLDLELRSGALSVTWKRPVAYQVIAGARRAVTASYVRGSGKISLALGKYDRSQPLVIDPVIDLTYVVNGNSDDRGLQAGVDGAGNIYLAGLTVSSDFATTSGAIQATATSSAGSVYQVFVRKLSPDGSQLIYSTYLGTTPFYSAHPLGMRVDAGGNVYVATNAFNSASSPAAIAPNGTVTVYKIAPAGDRLVYQNRVLPGSNYTDSIALAIDATGNAYAAIGTSPIGVAKIDPSGQKQLYSYSAPVSNYFGGLADIAVGNDGTLYIAGSTAAGGLVTTAGAFQSSVASLLNYHGFLIRLKADGSAPVYATYIAGNFIDMVSSVAVDASGAAYVGGQTNSATGFPAIQGSALGTAKAPQSAGFVMKINPAGNAALYTALLPANSVNALAVDSSGAVYASGQHSSGYLAAAKIDASGSKLLYYSTIPAGPLPNTQAATSFGMMLGLAVDGSGAAYVTGSLESLVIPVIQAPVRFAPNAFLLKMDKNPDQCDLQVQGSTTQATAPGAPTPAVFTITNAGPAAATAVGFSATSQAGAVSCSASGNGVCDAGSLTAYFPSIAPGASETVQVTITAPPAVGAVVTASVTTVTSDVSLDNNTATAEISGVGAVSVQIQSLQFNSLTFQVTGSYQPGNYVTGGQGGGFYAAPGGQIQVYFPSPQESSLGPVVFHDWLDGSTDNPRTFTAPPPQVATTASFSLLQTPYLAATGVANAASYASNGVSPGEFITLSGFNLELSANAQSGSPPFPLTLGGTTVTFDGAPPPLVYVSPRQVNAIVPYEIAGRSSTTIVVTAGSKSASATVPVIQAAPALFTSSSSGAGQAAALNQDGSVNSAANPANPGDVIVLYGTGEGQVTPTPVDGSTTQSPAAIPNLPVTVTIGGASANVLYAAEAPGLAAGVIQINARIPAGIAYSHHTPVTWSAGNFTSQSGATVAIGDSPLQAAVFDASAQNTSLPPIQISPARVAADSGAATITISGAGFTGGMTALWNNQPRPTTFVNSTTLKLALSGMDLETPQLSAVTVWDAAQTRAVSQTAALLAYVPVLNRDLIYDSSRDRIYVAVAATQVPQGSSIAVLNPETGRIEQWYAMDGEPIKLALSPDNRYLFIAVGSTIERVDLNSWTKDLTIPITPDPGFGTMEAFTMVNLFGEDNSLAVSFFSPNLSPSYLGTGIFDGATLRETTLPGHGGPPYLVASPDPGTVYGASGGDFYTLHAAAVDITVAGLASGLLGGDGDTVYAGGLVYGGWGSAIDPKGPTVVQAWGSAGLIVPLPDLNKVLILGGANPPGYGLGGPPTDLLDLYDASTAARLWSVALPVQIAGNHGPMIRWGSNGIALREYQVYNNPAPGVDIFRLNLGQ